MAKITYNDKVNLKLVPVPNVNKVRGEDLNEIKQSVNDLYDVVGVVSNDLDALELVVAGLESAKIRKGTWDASTGVFPGGGVAQAGWYYINTGTGTIAGIDFEPTDTIESILDNASTSVYVNNWFKTDNTDKVLSVRGSVGPITNVPKTVTFATIPTVTDDSSAGYLNGDEWTNSATGLRYKIKSNSIGAAIWEQIGGGGTALGNVLFVSTTGSNTEIRANAIGNINKPLTHEQVKAVASPYDSVFVLPGDYTLTLTGTNGYAFDGAKWDYAFGARTFKATPGPQWSTAGLTNGCDVVGMGSFYGSGSCGRIYYDGMSAKDYFFQGNYCENTAAACHETAGVNSGIHNIRFKTRIKSTASYAILPGGGTAYIDCPEIVSTVTDAAYFYQCQKVFINGNRIENTTGGIGLQTSSVGSIEVNASYVNYSNINTSLSAIMNVATQDAMKFNGSNFGILNCSGQVTAYEHVSGQSNIKRLYTITFSGAGNGTVNAGYIGGQTLNLSSSNPVEVNLTFENYTAIVAATTLNISSSNVTVNLFGKNNRGLLGTISAGRLNIKNYNALITQITGGGKSYCLHQTGGIIEIPNEGFLDSSANTTSTLYLIWKEGGIFIGNGGKMITYDASQICVGDSATAQDVKLLSGGINTNDPNFLTPKTGKLLVTNLITGTVPTYDADITE